eukprot:gene45765-57026_t
MSSSRSTERIQSCDVEPAGQGGGGPALNLEALRRRAPAHGGPGGARTSAQYAAVALAAPRKPGAWRRIKPHWKPLATAAVLMLGLFSFSNLPVRLQADHLTVVGERQRLQLDEGSNVLLNTDSAFSSTTRDHQRIARLYQGEAFFE